MSRSSRQQVEDVLRAVHLRTVSVLEGNPQADGSKDTPGLDTNPAEQSELMSLEDSQVLLLSLRQTRQHHLSSLLPVFPIPKPIPKSRNKPKAVPGASKSTDGPPTPTTEETPFFPPFLLRALGGTHPSANANTITMRVGPMTFAGVTLWECRFDEASLKAAGHPAMNPVVVQPKVLAEVQMGHHSGQSTNSTPQSFRSPPLVRAPPFRPLGPPASTQHPSGAPRPPSGPAPAIIHLVNLEASIHPWLATLIQRAARNLATPEELKRLGQVVDILGKGKRLVPPVRSVPPVREMPEVIRFVDAPLSGGPVGMGVPQGQRPVVQGQAQSPGQASGSGYVRPLGPPQQPQTRPFPAPMLPPPPRPYLPNRIQGEIIGSPRLYPQMQGATGQSGLPRSTSQHINQPSVPTYGPRPSVPLQHSQYTPVQAPPLPPPVHIPYIPPVLLCSFRENSSDKFVIPIELAYISYERKPVKTSAGSEGTMRVSTFLPSKGWGKWTFPDNAKPSIVLIKPPSPRIVDLTTSPTSEPHPASSDGPALASRKRARMEVPLPLLTKPYTLGGVTISPGPLQCVNIVLEGVDRRSWEVVRGLIKEVEGDREERGVKLEGGAPVERDRMVESPVQKEAMPGTSDIAAAESTAEVLSRPKRGATQAVAESGESDTPAVLESPTKMISRKAQIFNLLMKRVPPREFLQYRVPAPVPKEYAIALGDPFAAVYRNVANKLPGEDFMDEPEVEPTGPAKRKKRDLSPTVTFELPMSFEGVEEAIVAQGVSSVKKSNPGPKKPIVTRGTVGKPCEGCGNQRKVWRIGPNGSNTLCFACGVKFQEGRLGKEDLALPPARTGEDADDSGMREVVMVKQATAALPAAVPSPPVTQPTEVDMDVGGIERASEAEMAEPEAQMDEIM